MRGQWIGMCVFCGPRFKISNGFGGFLPALCLRLRTASGVRCLLQLHARRDTPLWLLPPTYGPRTALVTARMAVDQDGRPPQPPRQRPPWMHVAVASAVAGRVCVCVCAGCALHQRGLRVVGEGYMRPACPPVLWCLVGWPSWRGCRSRRRRRAREKGKARSTGNSQCCGMCPQT